MLSKAIRNAYACYFVPWMALTAHRPIGENIFDTDWDLCIVLDACRVDALRKVSVEYEFIDTVDKRISLGSSSKEWMVNTFRSDRQDDVSETVYLTGNGWAQQILSCDPQFATWTITRDTFAHDNSLVEKLLYRPTVTADDFHDVVYQPLSNMNGIEGFDAEQLTDLAIQSGREDDAERVLVHYMQPHAPFLHRVGSDEPPSDIDQEPITLLQNGYDRGPIWEGYLDNLRYVLDYVEILLENFDGDVLITADHGEMMYGGLLSGHGEGILHPALRFVPWVELTATDKMTRDVDVTLNENVPDDVDDRLSALGYK